MKAVVQRRYGSIDALHVSELPMPEPAPDEVLVRVRAASVHADVWHMVVGQPWVLRLIGGGLLRPANPVPGTDVAGVVEAVGPSVTRWRPGDEVFGETTRGYTWANGGAFAEYVAVVERNLAKKPSQVSFEEAAAIPSAGFIALINLRGETELRPGQRVLVNGAAGAVGGVTVQLAKAAGAHVTGVDLPDKLDLVRALGADRVIDATREDFTQARYDLIVDVASNLLFADCQRALDPGGKYVLIGHDHYGAAGRRVFGSIPRFVALMMKTPFAPQIPKVNFATPPKQEAMETLRRLLESGQLKPIIDKVFPLSEAAAALHYLTSGRARGKIIVAT